MKSAINPMRQSAFNDSVSDESDMTVLPEEVCEISIGSDESATAKARKDRAAKRKKDLYE